MKAAFFILLITLIIPFHGATSAKAEPSWFPFQNPCNTEWIEGERYYCETIYSETEFLSAENGEEVRIKGRRFCRLGNGAFTAILKEGERGYLADDGDYETNQVYSLNI